MQRYENKGPVCHVTLVLNSAPIRLIYIWYKGMRKLLTIKPHDSEVSMSVQSRAFNIVRTTIFIFFFCKGLVTLRVLALLSLTSKFYSALEVLKYLYYKKDL